jgi:hypothetical protein
MSDKNSSFIFQILENCSFENFSVECSESENLIENKRKKMKERERPGNSNV